MAELNQTTYTPGRWVAVSARTSWLLVDLPPEDPVVRRCWKLLSEDAGADAVLDALATAGIVAMPSFALVCTASTGIRAITRHPATATAHFHDADAVVVAGADGVSWVDEVIVRKPEAVTLTGATTTGSTVELPMGTGVTTAASVHVVSGVPVTDRVDEPIAGPERTTADSAKMSGSSSRTPAESTQPELRPPPKGHPSASHDVVQQSSELAAQITDEPLPSYDFLFGATQRPLPVQPETPPNPEPAAPDRPPTSPLPTHQTAGWRTESPPAMPNEVPVPSAGSGLIQGLPWMSPEAPPVPAQPLDADAHTAPPADKDASGVDFSATINRAQLKAVGEPATTGPTVLAGYCPGGHLSPPHASFCRVCRAAMPTQDAFEVPRPVLGAIRLSIGDVIELDRGVLFGRAPDVPSGGATDRPHVVRLKSPENDISRNHAELVLDGWNVYVRDLGSVNGTTVALRDQAAVRLRDNDLQLLENGAVVALADEVSFTFEVTE